MICRPCSIPDTMLAGKSNCFQQNVTAAAVQNTVSTTAKINYNVIYSICRSGGGHQTLVSCQFGVIRASH